jgi:DNA-3-methyladenine glycosylase II
MALLEQDMTVALITDENISHAIKVLSESDPKLQFLFDAVGPIPVPNQNLEYRSVCRIIVNQQLSGKAADTIFGRIEKCIPDLNAKSVLEAENDMFRSCGVSRGKAEYLKLLAEKLHGNPNYFEHIAKMETHAAKHEIWSNKGFGEWSSEIFLLFYLKRSDVFPKGDVTLNKVIAKLYGIDHANEGRIYELSKTWSPYRSVVSLALWRFFDLGLMKREN